MKLTLHMRYLDLDSQTLLSGPKLHLIYHGDHNKWVLRSLFEAEFERQAQYAHRIERELIQLPLYAPNHIM
jgi:hypothetical protein